MNIINASAIILRPSATLEAVNAVYRAIETAGRTCYKSKNKKVAEIEKQIEDLIQASEFVGFTEKYRELEKRLEEAKIESAKQFVLKLVENGHEAMLEHANMTVKFIVDRGVSHELVRHRIASLAQESTRYCVAGETVLRAMSQKHWTVEELYEWQNDPKRKSRIKLINMRSVDETTNKIIPNHIKNIFKVGKKETYKITTETGRSLTCTLDHEIYTPNGYIKLSELKVGDVIYSNGKELLNNEDWLRTYYITQNHTRKETAKEIGCCESYVYRAFKKFGIEKPLSNRPNRKPGHSKKGAMTENGRITLSNRMKGNKNPSYIEDRSLLTSSGGYAEAHRKYDDNKDKCEFCGSKKNIEIHHKNKNPIINDKNNVLILCSKCHKAVHKQGTIAVIPDKIISIEYSGTRTVYDVQMESPYNNFVANSIVVHNCNYSNDKFGNEITVIEPCIFNELTEKRKKEIRKIADDDEIWSPSNLEYAYFVWYIACKDSEKAYMHLIERKTTPEIARSVLPNSLKTELIITANMREWKNIFKLRAAGEHGKPHPQMLEVMIPLLEECQTLMPELFGDIKVSGKND